MTINPLLMNISLCPLSSHLDTYAAGTAAPDLCSSAFAQECCWTCLRRFSSWSHY